MLCRVAHQPFSAGVMDVACNETLIELRSELEDEKAEHSVTKAYYCQVDDAYNQEAEEVAEFDEAGPGEGREQDGR